PGKRDRPTDRRPVVQRFVAKCGRSMGGKSCGLQPGSRNGGHDFAGAEFREWLAEALGHLFAQADEGLLGERQSPAAPVEHAPAAEEPAVAQRAANETARL